MTAAGKKSKPINLDQQGAEALLATTFAFLRHNKISAKLIIDFAHSVTARHQGRRTSRPYRDRLRAYEDMGILMSTWYSDPRFLDASGNPRPLSRGKGLHSIAHLVRVSRARVQASVALGLMRASPSVEFRNDGSLVALKRVFVLPNLDVPRAAFVIERYLNTLQRNASGRKKEKALLLERSCHVSEVDLAEIAPVLRDIEDRGTAFMDSIDGDIEDRRLRSSKGKSVGELGVLVFAWTAPNKNESRRLRDNR